MLPYFGQFVCFNLEFLLVPHHICLALIGCCNCLQSKGAPTLSYTDIAMVNVTCKQKYRITSWILWEYDCNILWYSPCYRVSVRFHYTLVSILEPVWKLCSITNDCSVALVYLRITNNGLLVDNFVWKWCQIFLRNGER